jgi:hypothetical protein
MRALSALGKILATAIVALGGALLAVAVFLVALPVWIVVGVIAAIALFRARGRRIPDLRRGDLGIVA